MATLKMFDVSDANGDVDWAAARKAGYEVVGIKASEGQDFVARTWTKARVAAVRKSGIEFTPYHYLRFRRDRNGAVEGAFAVKTALAAGWTPGKDLPITLDAEWIGNETELRAMTGDQVREYVSDAADRVKALTKRGCILYLSPAFAAELGNKPPRSATVTWVAAWDSPDGHPPTPRGFKSSLVRMHQTSDAKHVGFVASGVIDDDLYLGDRVMLQAWIAGKPTAKPSIKPNPSKPAAMSIRELQTTLKAIGWPLTVDGKRGPMTVGALMDFQRGFLGAPHKALVRDGVAGTRTVAALRWSARHGGAASPHFKFREFASSHAPHWIKTHRALVAGLEALRRDIGHPVGILSAYRDFALGASKSQHHYGNAIDPNMTLPPPAHIARLHVFSGIGYDPQRGGPGTAPTRHVDVRHVGPNFTAGTLSQPTIFTDTF